MKIPNKVKSKKVTVKKKPIDKSKNGKVLVVAQEIKFARLLSGNDKKSRDRVLKTLKKWLVNCFAKNYDFKESDFIRIWKGLFYAVWMSDKPLVQEELCDNIAETLDNFPPDQLKYALMMTVAGYEVLAKEWFGIDLHRLDKFLMLVRRLLRGILRCLKRCEWSDESCEMFTKALFTGAGVLATETPMYARNATSMVLHILDCYLEEICKVSNGTIPPTAVTILFTPLASLLTFSKNMEVVRAARRTFAALIRQSDEGISYQEKQEAWKQMGCPVGGPDALELDNESDDDGDGDETQNDEDSDDDSDDSEETESCNEESGDVDAEENVDEEGPLDPRAGRVNVTLNTIPVPSKELAEVLKMSLPKCGSKAQKRTRIVIQRFEALTASKYPFPLVVPDKEPAPVGGRARALALVKHEEKLCKSSDELGLKGLSRKQKKRLLAKARAGVSIVEEVEELKAKTNPNGKRRAQVTESDVTEPPAKMTKKLQNDTNSNKENVEKIRNQTKKQKQDKATNGRDNKSQKHKLEEKQSLQVKNKVEKVQKKERLASPKQNGFKVTNIKNVRASPSVITATKQNGHIKERNIKNKKLISVSEKEKPAKIIKKLDKIKEVKQPKNADKSKSESNVSNKIKNYQKAISSASVETPKKVKFVLHNNSMQAPVDYYKSVRKSPSIPFDGSKVPTKTNLKPSTPSPINPFLKKKLKLKARF